MERALMISTIGLSLVIMIQFVLYAGLVRLLGRFLHQFRHLPPPSVKRSLIAGESAPQFAVLDQTGRTVTLESVQGSPVLLLFVLHTCRVCKEILPRLQEIRETDPSLQLIVIASEEGEGEMEQIPDGVSFVRSNSMRQAYFAKFVPALVRLSPDGRIISSERVMSFADFELRVKGGDKHVGLPVEEARRLG